ncbi:hypothetical protein [Micromonospora sediminicola]|uniref:hypothetical protein n=1 Tax=Micromonospora sediminicola TaxID=946078 RepID=UPI0037A539C6
MSYDDDTSGAVDEWFWRGEPDHTLPRVQWPPAEGFNPLRERIGLPPPGPVLWAPEPPIGEAYLGDTEAA